MPQRIGTIPGRTNTEVFIYKEDLDEKGYEQVIMSFQQLASREPGVGFGILSEEALLNLYTWATKLDGISEEGNSLEDQNSPDLLRLLLLFNDDALGQFNKAKHSAYKYDDRPVLRTIFSQRFRKMI